MAQRRPRFTPRNPKRARYYKASLVAASVFVVLAVAFPFWLDHVRRIRDRDDLDVPRSVAPPVKPQTTPVPVRPKPPGSQLPYAPESGYASCQAYAAARCNALGIPPGPCGEVMTAALAVPPTAGLSECRKTVEPKLTEAVRLHGVSRESEAPAQAPPPLVEAVESASGPPPTSDSPAPSSRETPQQATTPESPPPAEPSPLSPSERADNLARIHVLVEELQRGAQNYATLPAAQAARFEELRRRVEADGSEELRSIYNNLLMQHGRTAGLEMPRPGLHATESPMVQARPGEEQARTTTPEMDRVRMMLEEARSKAGLGEGGSPSLSPTSPPTSVDPSTVQAPPARSL